MEIKIQRTEGRPFAHGNSIGCNDHVVLPNNDQSTEAMVADVFQPLPDVKMIIMSMHG